MFNSVTRLLNFLMPQRCLLCDVINHGLLCPSCCQCLYSDNAKCPQCGINMPEITRCGDCIKQPPYFDKVIACFDYRAPVSDWLSAFKFQQKLYFAAFFAQQLEKTIPPASPIKRIVAMPLHKSRLRQRGFNQAHEIAKRIAHSLNINYESRLITRTKHRPAQTTLNYKNRKQNVENIFKLKKPLSDTHIAIIDDVVTTGSSVNEIAKLLKQNGAHRVEVWCIARTQR